jgi:outer membrane protein assembly factor BamB
MHLHLAWRAVLLLPLIARAGDWPQFRGPDRDAISKETGLLRQWPAGGPRVLWQKEVCEGYAGAAILGDRVFFEDYDKSQSQWLARCLSLSDGTEIWRVTEGKKIRPNHGITRAVPAVDEKHAFFLDPKCVFHCIDVNAGREVWRKDLVEEYGTTIPPWYAGQCPLIEGDRVVIAPGGTSLVAAFEKATGTPIWQTPNPQKLTMSHSSLMPAEIGGVKQYLYCTLSSVVGVAARDGQLLWSFPWKFNVAVPTSPVAIGDGRIFLTSCYEADTVMIRVSREGETFRAEKVFSIPSSQWNSEVHTPIHWKEHLFAVGKKQRGLWTCLDLDGRQVWTSEGKASFELGSYLLADGMFFVLEGKTGVLRLLRADPAGYTEVSSAHVLTGPDVWAPMALSNGQLVVRDMSKMLCLSVK